MSERRVRFVFLTKTTNVELKLQSEEYWLCKHELKFVDKIPEILKEDYMHSGTGRVAETEVNRFM